MNNPHDDDLDARLKELKRRQAAYSAAHPGRYYLLSDTEMDDIASYHQIKTLDRLAEKHRLEGKKPPTPSVPKQSLFQALLDIGCVDGRTPGQVSLKEFEVRLAVAVAEINATLKN